MLDEDAEYSYWNRAFYVHIPKNIIDAANGKNKFYSVSFSTQYSGEKAGSWKGNDNIVRTAQCLLPKSEKALELVRNQLQKFGNNVWKKTNLSYKAQNESECGQWYEINICSYDPETNTAYDCFVIGPFCAYYVEEEEPDPFGGGGSGGGFGSEEPGECDPLGTEPCFVNGGGGWTPQNNDPEPCETGDELLDDLAVQGHLKNLWALQESTGKEQGGWLHKLPWGVFFDPIPENLIEKQTFDIIEFYVPEILQQNSIFVHTHPTQSTVTKFGRSRDYLHQPSEFDYEVIKKMNTRQGFSGKGMILDPNFIITFNENGIKDLINRCGY